MKRLRCIDEELTHTIEYFGLDSDREDSTMLDILRESLTIIIEDDDSIYSSRRDEVGLMFRHRGYTWSMKDFKEIIPKRLIGGELL